MNAWRLFIYRALLIVFVPVSALAPSYKHCIAANGHDAIELADGGHHIADREVRADKPVGLSAQSTFDCADVPLMASATDASKERAIVRGPVEGDLPVYLVQKLPRIAALSARLGTRQVSAIRTEPRSSVQLAMHMTIVLRI